MNRRVYCLAIGLFTVSRMGWAYEVDTHARLTEKAYQQSRLVQDAQVLTDMNIDPSAALSVNYYDVSGTEIWVRGAQRFSQRKMSDESVANTVIGWLMRGAIREDDTPAINNPVCQYNSGAPEDDPYGDFARVRHHFYNPLNGQPLTMGLGIPLGAAAPDWVSGRDDAFDNQSVPTNGKRDGIEV